MADPTHDHVIVLTEDEIQTARNGGCVEKPYGDSYLAQFSASTDGLEDGAGHVRGCIATAYLADDIRNGNAVNYTGNEMTDAPPISVIHEDYAGTPKSDEALAEWLFERFKASEGETRSLALETLHKLGYSVETNTEYTLTKNE